MLHAAPIHQGPVDRKMVINASNSGATQFMADFEGGRGMHGEGPPGWGGKGVLGMLGCCRLQPPCESRLPAASV